MKLYDILDTLRTDLATDLPDLITAAGLPALDNYVIGQSRNENEKAICVYGDEQRKDSTRYNLSLIFQAQLKGVSYEDGIKYHDVIYDYLFEYKPENIEYNILDNLQSEIWPMERSQGVFLFFSAQYFADQDSCNDIWR